MNKRIVVGITGASGTILGIHLLNELKKKSIETHLIISDWGKRTIELETNYTVAEVCSLADCVYASDDMAASVSSGSFQTMGMVIVPCSMKSLSAIAHGYSDNLIARAADVTLKESRKLVVVPRETPLSTIHIQNMLSLSQLGAILLPPCVAFYSRPNSLDDIINHLTGKILDAFGIENELYQRWSSPNIS